MINIIIIITYRCQICRLLRVQMALIIPNYKNGKYFILCIRKIKILVNLIKPTLNINGSGKRPYRNHFSILPI